MKPTIELALHTRPTIMKIVRYLPLDAANQVLGVEKSTFLLRSLNYYKNLEHDGNNTGQADPMENQAEFTKPYSKSISTKCFKEFCGSVLVTCWSILNENTLPYPCQLNFSNGEDFSNGIAVVSEVDCLETFLVGNTKSILPNWEFEHAPVNYYSEKENKPDGYSIPKAMFWKRDSYSSDNEYRFAFITGSPNAHLQTIIFETTDPSYIKEIHFGPKLTRSEKINLYVNASTLKIANLVKNFD